MGPGDDIENQFASAVRLALEARDAISSPPEVAVDPVRRRSHGRARQWLVALLYTALTATVAIIVAAALLR